METQLAPGFLVASPHLKDPFFSKTVIFLVEHEHAEGSFGIILNKTVDVQMRSIFSELKIDVDEADSPRQFPEVLEGGPVTPELGWVIHSADWNGENTRIFDGEVGVTASIDILQDIAKGKGPARFWFCLGYSGWGPNQLLRELQSGSWLHVPLSTDLFFDVPREDAWQQAISKLGIDPAYISPQLGGA